MLLPLDLREWVLDNHLVHFVVEAVDGLPLTGFKINHRGTGDAQYPPRMATLAGKAIYKLRKQTVEPVFGIIKDAMGFRRFLLRGIGNVSLEWTEQLVGSTAATKSQAS